MRADRYAEAAAWLARQQTGARPLVASDKALPSGLLARSESGVLAGRLAAVDGCHGEVDHRDVFLLARAPQKELEAAFGRCRYLACDAGDLERIDELAGPRLARGHLENVALRVRTGFSPEGAEGFDGTDGEGLARLVRQPRNLAVRGMFLPLDPADDLCAQVRDAFSLVKKLRSDLPCMLHAFCLEGVLEPLAAGDPELLKAVRMVASLNDTSLYAHFFVS